MEIDLTLLAQYKEYIAILTVLGCLVLGYLVKHSSLFKWVKNDNIPMIVAITGAILNPLITGLSVESVIVGAFLGLASTGLHQWFKSFIENFANFFNLNNNK